MARQPKSKMSKEARDFISKKIKTLMRDFNKTGKIGNSQPPNRSAAQRQAIAVAFSMAQREGYKVAKNAEERHNEVLALEEAFDLEEKDFALAQECVAAGGHEFSESMNKIFGTFMPILLEDNAQTNQYFRRNQYMGPQSLNANNVRFLQTILNMACNPQNYNLDIEPMPLECSRCGAVDWRVNNRWSPPSHPGLTFQQVMAMGVTTQCKLCGIHHAANQEAQHGEGLCVPLYDEITICKECEGQAWLGVGNNNRNIYINIGEPDQQQILLVPIDSWKQTHGKGKCRPEAEIHCEHCDLTFTIGQGNTWNYRSMDHFKELHGSREDEKELDAKGELDYDLCWGWKGYKISVADMKRYARNMMGLAPYEFNALNRNELLSMLISNEITPLEIVNMKKAKKSGATPAPAAPAAKPASIEELSPQEIYGLLSKKPGLFENLMNYYHQQHGAEGEERKKNINLVLDQGGFFRTSYPYPYIQPSSYTTKILGGRDVFFKKGIMTVDILNEREDSIDVLVKDFKGEGIFNDNKEPLEGNKKFKGRVIFGLSKGLYRREDEVWQEMVDWDEDDKINGISNDWENLSWGAEGHYISMVGDEEVMNENYKVRDKIKGMETVKDTLIPLILTLGLLSVVIGNNYLKGDDSGI